MPCYRGIGVAIDNSPASEHPTNNGACPLAIGCHKGGVLADGQVLDGASIHYTTNKAEVFLIFGSGLHGDVVHLMTCPVECASIHIGAIWFHPSN